MLEKLYISCVTNADLRRPRYAALNEDERGYLSIFPNPSDGNLKIAATSPISGMITIFDSKGSKVFASNLKLDKEPYYLKVDFTNGIYELIFLKSNGEIYTRKIVVEK